MSSSGVLTSDSSGFAHLQTLFVDPNGNDTTAEIGRMDLPWKTIKGAFDEINSSGGDEYTIIVRSGLYTENNAIEILGNYFISLILDAGVQVSFRDAVAFFIDASINTGVGRVSHLSISSTIRGTSSEYNKGPLLFGSGPNFGDDIDMFKIVTNKSINTSLTEIVLSLNNVSIINTGEQSIVNISGEGSDDIDIKVRVENSFLYSNTSPNSSSLIHFDYNDPTNNKLSLNIINSILDSTGPHIDLSANSRLHRFGLSNNTFIYRGSNTSSYILTNSETDGTFNNNLFWSETPFKNYIWIDFSSVGSMVNLGHQLGNLDPNLLSGVVVINSGGVIESSDVFDPREYMSEWI
jgi:hypothetical protein